jgi:hypothetical protein
MRRLGIVLGLTLLAGTAYAHSSTHSSTRVSIDGDNCSSRNFTFDDRPGYAEEQVIEAGNLRSLKAAVEHAPISVVGGNASGYTITVCKAAAMQQDLAAIHVSVEGGELKTSGPAGDRWTVSYQIRVPRNADLDLEAENGPISIRDVDGTIVARAQNGPLSLENLSGNVEATTTNGPISVDGGSGTMKLRASNGPLAVTLTGGSWTGGSLDAATKNGPLTLEIPRGYNSGVIVESNGRGPVACRAEGCDRFRAERDARGDDDDDQPRTIELGNGSAAVHLSTVNGPIRIKDAK